MTHYPVKLVGNKLCIFCDSVESLLIDNHIEYSIEHDPSKLNYPMIHHKDLEMCGFLAIAEYVVNFNSIARQVDITNSMNSEKREKYNFDIIKREANRRMWLFIILNEIWYGTAQTILHERIFKLSEGQTPDHTAIKHARSRLNIGLTDLNTWLSENIYIVDISCYSDILLSTIVAYLDYLQEIDWVKYPNLKGWHSAFKAKPSFKKLLEKTIPGHKAPAWYGQVTF